MLYLSMFHYNCEEHSKLAPVLLIKVTHYDPHFLKLIAENWNYGIRSTKYVLLSHIEHFSAFVIIVLVF